MSAAEVIAIRRSSHLAGRVHVPGAKNSVLKLIAATLLADGEYTLTNVPQIDDVVTMCALLDAMGVASTIDPLDASRVTLRNCGTVTPLAPLEHAAQIRASIAVLGPLLARCGVARVAMPGGDDFGSRPIDMHLTGLEALGATFEFKDGYLEGRSDFLRGADISLPFPSVGATENIMMSAVHAKGTTTLDNAAREPEIADLCHMLNAMGADIEGVGSPTLVIHGVEHGSLHAVEHAVVTDRIQVATYFAAVGVCGGDVLVEGARADHMEMVIDRMSAMGMSFTRERTGVRVACDRRLRAVDVATLPYPGIGTDYKPLMVTMLALAEGTGIVTENLYPGRFRYVEELCRMGARIHTDGHHAVVTGVERFQAAAVRAADIRAGAALVIAGLAADGETLISETSHIDRGYDDLVGRLASIGARIERLPAVNA